MNINFVRSSTEGLGHRAFFGKFGRGQRFEVFGRCFLQPIAIFPSATLVRGSGFASLVFKLRHFLFSFPALVAGTKSRPEWIGNWSVAWSIGQFQPPRRLPEAFHMKVRECNPHPSDGLLRLHARVA